MGIVGSALLVFAFFVIIGTLIAIVALSRRQSSPFTIDLDNEIVAPRANQRDRWPLVDPIIELFQAAESHLPGLYRPIGTILGALLALSAGTCLMSEGNAGNAVGMLTAILGVVYGSPAWERARVKSWSLRSRISRD